MKQVLATVIKNLLISEASHISIGRTISKSHLIWLECPQIAAMARPGQFVMVRCGSECTLPRPFSIHRVNDMGNMALLFSVWEDGKGTIWLSQRQSGDTIELFGPLGNGFSINHASHNLLLVAGGIGIAPLYFLAEEALKKEYSVTLLCGTKRADLIDQLRIKNPLSPKAKLVMISEEDTTENKGRVTDLLTRESIDSVDQIFISGPMLMYRDIALKKRELKLEGKPAQISLEVRMGCGLGVCYGCTVKTKSGLKQVCKDGPIFNLEDILWDELAYNY